MSQDEEGFKYPRSNDRCVRCRQCEAVCPIHNGKTELVIEIEQIAVAAVTNYKVTWNASTSGGAFTEICYAFGDSETVVFGAKFDRLKVVHDYVIGVKNINDFRKSKYVQSDMGDSFNITEKFLLEGKKVIFSGTPCQIAGLRSYLGKKYEQLFCIDLICHGAGSQKVFDDVIHFIEHKYATNIERYTFRAKKVKLGNFKLFLTKYDFKDNFAKYVNMDEYNQLYLKQLCLRPSCGKNCRFRTCNRLGDITIADFKGQLEVFPNLKDFRNYSTLIVNTMKGHLVYDKLKCKMKILPCSLDDVRKFNPLFYRHTTDNPLRDAFFIDYTSSMETKEIIDKYTVVIKGNKTQFIKAFIPYVFKVWLRMLKKQIIAFYTKKLGHF